MGDIADWIIDNGLNGPMIGDDFYEDEDDIRMGDIADYVADYGVDKYINITEGTNMEYPVNKLRGKAFQVQEKYTKGGNRFVVFNLSYSEGKDTNGNHQYGSIKVTVFGERGATLQLADKDYVEVSGFLHCNKWEDKHGQKRYDNEINAKEVDGAGGQRELPVRDTGDVPF